MLSKVYNMIQFYFNPIIKEWFNSYLLQTDVGVRCIVTEGCCCPELLLELALFHLKN